MSAIEFIDNTFANFSSLAYHERFAILFGIGLVYFCIFMIFKLLIQVIILAAKRWSKKHE